MINRLDRRAPQVIGRRALMPAQRLERSNPSSDPDRSIKKGVDIQTAAASELQVPLVESVGLMVSPCVAELRMGIGTGRIHGRWKAMCRVQKPLHRPTSPFNDDTVLPDWHQYRLPSTQRGTYDLRIAMAGTNPLPSTQNGLAR